MQRGESRCSSLVGRIGWHFAFGFPGQLWQSRSLRSVFGFCCNRWRCAGCSQAEDPMKNHCLIIVACFAAAVLGAPALALADGGTLRASQVIGENRISIFTSPAVLRVGTIDISVLAQDAKTGAILRDSPIRIRLECIDRAVIPLEQEATFAAATNKLFRAAQFDVPEAGNWRTTVVFGEPAQSPTNA